MMYLANERVPEEVVKQPELILNSPAVQLARPLLNRQAEARKPGASCRLL